MSLDYGAEQEGKLQHAVSQAHEAQTILDHPLFLDAFAKVRKRINDEFESCKPDDTAKLLRCKLTLDILKCVERELRDIKTGGEMAKQELSRIGKIRERLKLKGWIDR